MRSTRSGRRGRRGRWAASWTLLKWLRLRALFHFCGKVFSLPFSLSLSISLMALSARQIAQRRRLNTISHNKFSMLFFSCWFSPPFPYTMLFSQRRLTRFTIEMCKRLFKFRFVEIVKLQLGCNCAVKFAVEILCEESREKFRHLNSGKTHLKTQQNSSKNVSGKKLWAAL